MDWGMLGYYVGEAVQERIPVLTGRYGQPDLIRHKHFGAAAASSGGVEMYHIVGVTPEAPTLEARPRQAHSRRRRFDTASRGRAPRLRDAQQQGQQPGRRLRDARLPALLARTDLRDAAGCSPAGASARNCSLWIFTSRAVKHEADRLGLHQARSATPAALLLTDTCSAISQAVPPGTKVAALDSAKQAHYLPAIMGIQAWFGSTGRLHRRGDARPLERAAAMSGTRPIILARPQGRRRRRRRRSAGHARDRSPAGAASNPMQGTIIETRHELRGQSFKDKVLVFPGAKGSSGWSAVFHMTRLAGTAPQRTAVQRDDDQDRARRRRDARAHGHGSRPRSARR